MRIPPPTAGAGRSRSARTRQGPPPQRPRQESQRRRPSMGEHDLHRHVEISDSQGTVASADVTISEESDRTARASLRATAGHLTPGIRASLVDAVLDLPEVQGGLSKTQFEEIETDGRAEGIKKCVKWPPVIGEKDLPGLEVRNRALDRSTDGTDLAIVFVFTRVEFTFPRLLGRRDVARPLESLVGDNRSGRVENLLHSAFQLPHVMVTSRRRV